MNTNVHITVLVDNAEAPNLRNEWGLSLLVRHTNTRVLLDFGQTDAFATNAKRLGIDLAAVDCAVLSHAHYDHANGMEAFFQANAHAPLYLSEACHETCWSTKGGTVAPHYIGVRPGLLPSHVNRLRPVPTDRPTTIAPGMHVLPHTTAGLANKGARDGMLLHTKDGWQPDDYAHEVSLVVELGTDAAAPLAVLNSCSHAGFATIAHEVAASFPNRHIAAFVGGLHLFQASDSKILHVAADLRAAGIERVYTGHCTGEHALHMLDAELPGCVFALRPGLSFEL